MRAQEGRHKTKDTFRKNDSAPEPHLAGTVVAIDHTEIDLHVLGPGAHTWVGRT